MALFLTLYAFARSWPRLCLGLGLGLFWTINVVYIAYDPSMMLKGIVVKVVFTMALVKGLQSASRANVLQRDLARVFE